MRSSRKEQKEPHVLARRANEMQVDALVASRALADTASPSACWQLTVDTFACYTFVGLCAMENLWMALSPRVTEASRRRLATRSLVFL